MEILISPPPVSFRVNSASKMIVNTGPFHYPIGYMAGVYLTVYGYREIGNRAIPNIMIALAMPLKSTSVFAEFLPDLLLVFRHIKLPQPDVPF
jgi:hypothetical protein